MTNDSMTVMQAVQQVGDEDLLRQLAEVALAKLMAFEVDGLVGAAKGKHTSERTTCRNGYRERPLHTQAPPRDVFSLLPGASTAE